MFSPGSFPVAVLPRRIFTSVMGKGCTALNKAMRPSQIALAPNIATP